VRRLLQIAVALALVAVPAAALASANSGRIDVTNCNRELYKPKAIVTACGDGTDILAKLKWTSWNRSGATGRGIDEVNPCKPDCASGHVKSFAATIKLSKPITCRKQKHKVFDLLTVTYTGKRPRGAPRTAKLSLGCPLVV
jgi:hypothetical protein